MTWEVKDNLCSTYTYFISLLLLIRRCDSNTPPPERNREGKLENWPWNCSDTFLVNVLDRSVGGAKLPSVGTVAATNPTAGWFRPRFSLCPKAELTDEFSWGNFLRFSFQSTLQLLSEGLDDSDESATFDLEKAEYFSNYRAPALLIRPRVIK